MQPIRAGLAEVDCQLVGRVNTIEGETRKACGQSQGYRTDPGFLDSGYYNIFVPTMLGGCSTCFVARQRSAPYTATEQQHRRIKASGASSER